MQSKLLLGTRSVVPQLGSSEHWGSTEVSWRLQRRPERGGGDRGRGQVLCPPPRLWLELWVLLDKRIPLLF